VASFVRGTSVESAGVRRDSIQKKIGDPSAMIVMQLHRSLVHLADFIYRGLPALAIGLSL